MWPRFNGGATPARLHLALQQILTRGHQKFEPTFDPVPLSTKKGAASVTSGSGGKRGARKAETTTKMTKVTRAEKQDQFEREFNEWVTEMEEKIESTRRSEQLTQEDFAVRINAQD